jgi:hypothetical protein
LISRLILIVIVLLLSPAAVVATTDCPADNWRTTGYRDGVNGQPVHWISRYRKACELAGSEFDQQAYLDARREGLERYCRAYNGYELGSRGVPYYGACPAPLEADFLHAYRTGAELYGLRREIRGIDREIAWYEDRLAELAATAGRDADELAERAARFGAEIDRLKALRAAYRDRLEKYKTRVASTS